MSIDHMAIWVTTGKVTRSLREHFTGVLTDNGKGTTVEELKPYFKTCGLDERALGSAHTNFGIGEKVFLLPWNHS